ncbi:MAG: PAS domain S-box protein [Desulfobacteraceae bacterium]
MMIDNIEKFKIGIVGGGKRCKALLESIFSEKDAGSRPEILGVADTNDQAIGLQYAREHGIFTTNDYRDLLSMEDLELVLELTQDDGLKQGIQAHKTPGVLVLDHYDALAILDAFRIQAKKTEVVEKLMGKDGFMTGCADCIEDFYCYVMNINKAANEYGRQTRQRMISSEQTLSQIINGTSIPTFVIDKDHKVTHWNRACEKLTGFSAQEMVGTGNHWKPFRPDKRPTMSDLILDGVSMEELWRQYGTRWEKSALMNGAYEVEEFFPHLGKSGTWLFFTAAPIKAPDGTIMGVIETLWDRTQRHEAEQALKLKTKELARTVEELRSNEQTLAQIINGSTIPTFVIDKSHRVTHWNRALERLTGCKAEEMIGSTKQWTPFYEKERAALADLILDQVDEIQIKQLYGTRWRPSVLIEDAYEAEVYFPDLGSGGKWCWFTAAPIRNAEGEVVAAIETIWDKTEDRKAVHERERHTQELATYCSIYATLSGSLNLEDRIKAAIEEVANIFLLDGICIFIRTADNQYRLRYSHGFSDNLCFLNRVVDDQSLVARIAREGRVHVFEAADRDDREIELLHREGFNSLAYIPLLDKKKNDFGVIRAASHTAGHFGSNEIRSLELIANRIGVAIENAILERENRQRAHFQSKLIGSSNDGIVATDARLNIVIFNPAAESIFGYAGAEVINAKSVREIYPPQIVQAYEATMAANATHHRSLPWQETVIVSREGLEIPVRFSGSVLRQKHKTMGIVTFFQDLREIKRLQRELVNAERLAAVGQTVAGMAHCVKNILHGLRGGSYMVNIGIDKNNTEKLKTGWNMVQRNIARTSDLVQDLLSYSKERQPEMASCRPNEIVQEVCELMQEVANENDVTLEMELSPQLQEVMLDQRSLHRSLLNLVSNAIDACRDDPTTGKGHRVKVITAVDPDDYIRFDVQDNGSGMSPEVKSKLFSSLFSTKGPQGTGLGLLVTSKLIEEHKGTIQVASELTRGTTFTIRLPLIAA